MTRMTRVCLSEEEEGGGTRRPLVRSRGGNSWVGIERGMLPRATACEEVMPTGAVLESMGCPSLLTATR
eukprot:CAMPEP_0113944568 /NCGR_PEP_ID=MMETSP1339-20121228/34503_1 /TAXON_ID=94617 /ORGANISM="Fibrocapsa japonica" /LENGTH=68 /DNA_ID=CAMNT_0000949805 /DNA_START=97 /DNA_END=300 /DNA_ORIENTATION=+ /assembly_acc=CAM_ASM_000762